MLITQIYYMINHRVWENGIHLLNTTGAILALFEAESGEKIILHSNSLPSGIYFIRVTNKVSGQNTTKKLSVIR